MLQQHSQHDPSWLLHKAIAVFSTERSCVTSIDKMAWVRQKKPKRKAVQLVDVDPTEPLRNTLKYFSCQMESSTAAAIHGPRVLKYQQQLLTPERSPERASSRQKLLESKAYHEPDHRRAESYHSAGSHHSAESHYSDDSSHRAPSPYEDSYEKSKRRHERSERHHGRSKRRDERSERHASDPCPRDERSERHAPDPYPKDVSPISRQRALSPAPHRRNISPAYHRGDISPAYHRRDVSPSPQRRDVSSASHRRDFSPTPYYRRERSPASYYRRDVSSALYGRDHSPVPYRRNISPVYHPRDISPEPVPEPTRLRIKPPTPAIRPRPSKPYGAHAAERALSSKWSDATSSLPSLS